MWVFDGVSCAVCVGVCGCTSMVLSRTALAFLTVPGRAGRALLMRTGTMASVSEGVQGPLSTKIKTASRAASRAEALDSSSRPTRDDSVKVEGGERSRR